MIPTIPTLSLLDGLDGMPKTPGAGVGTDLFSQLVACLGDAVEPAPVAGATAPAGEEPRLAAAFLAPLAIGREDSEAPVEDLEGEPAVSEQPAGGELPQAALIAVLTLQAAPARMAPVPAAPAAAAAIVSSLPARAVATALPAASSPAAPAKIAAVAPEKPSAALPQLVIAPGPAEAAKAARRTDQPQRTAQAAPLNAPAAPAPVAAERAVNALQAVFAQPAPAEAPAAAAVPDQAPATNIVEHAVEQQLDLAHESEWLDSLARDIVRMGDGGGTLRFRLHPESLGSLGVEMSQSAAGASIRLTADSEAARAIIADAQPRLVAEARAQGVRIAETHVDLGGSGHSAPEDQRGRRGTAEEILVRTFGGDGTDTAASPRPARAKSERYA